MIRSRLFSKFLKIENRIKFYQLDYMYSVIVQCSAILTVTSAVMTFHFFHVDIDNNIKIVTS